MVKKSLPYLGYSNLAALGRNGVGLSGRVRELQWLPVAADDPVQVMVADAQDNARSDTCQTTWQTC